MSGNHPAARIATLSGIAALAFIMACVAHEAVGHGGMCLLSGGHVTLLSSVYSHCSISSPMIDAAGPSMGIVVGLGLLAILRWRPIASPNIRLLLALAMAINLFWGFGYLLFSAVTNAGDWAFFVRGLAPSQQAIGRIAMGGVGVFAYAGSTRIVSTRLPQGIPLLIPYFTMGIVSCVAVFFYAGSIASAFREAVNEGFLAPVGLLLIARRRVGHGGAELASNAVVASTAWIATALVACIAFFATMGHGYASA